MIEHHILERLDQLEAINTVRHILHRYMELCDGLGADTDLQLLMALFDQDAIWEGIGQRYQNTFGQYRGSEAIADMFAKYTQHDSHFLMNAHFVNSEQIEVDQDCATGCWMMLQTSTFRDGKAHLNAAKLTVQFKRDPVGCWKISHFQTQNIFSRPVAYWDSKDQLPVPETASQTIESLKE